MIDIHCHILAEVDDGPRSWETAYQMCRIAAEDGIEHIVATPHASDRYHYDRESLYQRLDYLRQLAGQVPRFSLGCDFHLSYENLQDVLTRPDYYTIENSHYLLVELSNYSIPSQIGECFSRMVGVGIMPVITHPERNPILQQNPKRVLPWVELGCAVQITASALTGGWGERADRVARWLLERDAVHVLASDAHDARQRTPVLSGAREKVETIRNADVARALVEDNPGAIIRGQPLPYFPDPVMKK